MALSKFKINFHLQNIKYHFPKCPLYIFSFNLEPCKVLVNIFLIYKKFFQFCSQISVFIDKARCLMFFHNNKKANSSITCPDVIPVRIIWGKFFPFGCFNQVHPFGNLQLATPRDSNQPIMCKQRKKNTNNYF